MSRERPRAGLGERETRAARPLTVGDARALAARLLTAVGVAPGEAELTAQAIVLADAWGIGSHGLMRLPYYLRRLRAGGCDPGARLAVVADTGPLVAFDGQDGLGHWQLWRAAELARDRCAQHGIAAVSVGRSSHCGALGVYVLPPVEAGYAALVFSNGPAVMAPWGGHRPVLSSSPFAAGFPGRRPAIVDLASSAVARGRIAVHAARGDPLHEGWALDALGHPTTEPEAALRGMLAPFGGAKGFALAFVVEALTAGLVGPALSAQVTDVFAPEEVSRPQRISHLCLVLDPGRTAGGGGSALDRLDTLTALVREAGGRVPGERRTPPADIPPGTPLQLDPAVRRELDTWCARLRIR